MNLLFRADASVKMGTGHVMRCLALAQEWQDAGGRTVFAMAENTPSLQDRLGKESCEVIPIAAEPGSTDDARRIDSLARERKAEWVVVDGYQFGADYQRALKDAGNRVLFLDDYGHSDQYFADLVLNQNVCAEESLYRRRAPYTRLMLGPRYCLLRREFSAWRGWNREVAPICKRLLMLMGGSDPQNLTARAIEGLQLAELEGIETTVVVGGSNPHFAALRRDAGGSREKITVLRDVSDTASLMAASDVAISAAGSTCWELCQLALPALLVDVAPNQSALARELDRRGCAVHVGNATFSAEGLAAQLRRLIASHELRQSLSQQARELVDGRGASRVVSAMLGQSTDDDSKEAAPGVHVRLRRAVLEDVRLLWEWVNDPIVRQASFSTEPIPWEAHVAWFSERLNREGCLLLIAEDEGTACGQIRFESCGKDEWIVDISVRGLGLADRIMHLGVSALLAEQPGAKVHAYIKPTNESSIRMCQRAGFMQTAREMVREQETVHMTLAVSERERA